MSTLEDILARIRAVFEQDGLDSPTPSDPGPAGDPAGRDSENIAFWRDRIDAIDQLLLRLLNERSSCANTIGHIKKQLNLPIYVPEREKIVLDNVLKGNEGPLDDAAVRGLFERIIDETRSLERRKYQKPDQTPGNP